MAVADDENNNFGSNENASSVRNIFATIKPPAPAPHSTPFDSSRSKEWLKDNLQKPWWLPDESATKSRPQIITEYGLIREILWTFIRPTNCKFFAFDLTEQRVSVRDDLCATINNVSMVSKLNSSRIPLTLTISNSVCSD